MWANMRCRARQAKKGLEKGATMVEFALLAPLLFFLMFIIIELSLMFWVNLTMQYAVREGARYSVTGQSNLDPATVNQQRYLAVIQKIKDSSMGLYDRVNPTIVVNKVAQAPGTYGNAMFGAAERNYRAATELHLAGRDPRLALDGTAQSKHSNKFPGVIRVQRCRHHA